MLCFFFDLEPQKSQEIKVTKTFDNFYRAAFLVAPSFHIWQFTAVLLWSFLCTSLVWAFLHFFCTVFSLFINHMSKSHSHCSRR